MVTYGFLALGLGRHVRADRVIAVEPITGDERGPGNRTLVWVDGLDHPLVAARSETALLADLSAVPRTSPPRGEAPATAEPREDVEPPPSLF